MKKITDFPCTPFAQLPTPLYKLERLSREFGKNIYIKRDDMTGVALGGNKVRKLEFLLADAREGGRRGPHRRRPPVQPRHAHRRLCRTAGYAVHPGAEKDGASSPAAT